MSASINLPDHPVLAALDRTLDLPPAPDPTRPVAWTAQAERRPRLLITPEELADLKSRLSNPVEAEMLARMTRRLDRALESYAPPEPGAAYFDRGISMWQPYAALLYLLTGEEQRLRQAKELTLDVIKVKPVFASHSDLSASHLLTSISWAYDMLHEHWSDAERDAIRTFVTEFGLSFFSVSMVPVNYWASILLQNHCHVFWTALGCTGIAFRDEIPQAAGWADWAARFYRTISWLMPPDGTNCEGPSYGGYGNERRVIYYEAALRNHDEDLYAWNEREGARWYLHLSLPGVAPDRNAFPWGDNPPRYDTHGPVHTLLAYAKRFKDPLAQGLALDWWRRKVGANGYLTWLDILLYDPLVPEATPQSAGEPLTRHFADQDMICTREAWEKDGGTALSFICGPYQGHRLMADHRGDLGGAHCHADTASFMLYSRGEFLLCDPGYEKVKRTDHHNTVLVNGHGQLGADIKWFNVNRVLHFADSTKIQVCSVEDTGRSVGWVGDAAEIYVPEAKLTKFRRHVLYVRPDVVVVVDDLEADEASVFSQLWHAEGAFEALKGAAGWGVVQNQASLSVHPVALAEHGGQALKVAARRQELTDLTKAGQHQHELRIDSPRAKSWRFATVFAAGDAAGGPRVVKISGELPALRIEATGLPAFTATFDLPGAGAPKAE